MYSGFALGWLLRIRFGDRTPDVDKRAISRGGRPVHAGPKAYPLLRLRS